MVFQHFIILILAFVVCCSRIQQHSRASRDSPNPLSFGGNYIQPGEAPWLCPMYLKISRSRSEYICGSSLISNQYVVTAAHCVREKQSIVTTDPSHLTVICGIYDLKDRTDSNVFINEVQEIKVHPKWDSTSQRYDADIALMRLSKTVQFNNLVKRIALPSEPFAQNNINGIVVGYGRSEKEDIHENRPRKIQIPIIDTEECYQNHEIFSRLKSRDAFCAGKNGVIPCNGDSGSSFYFIQNSSPVLLGIVSSGISTAKKKCKEDAYVLFTDVFKFVNWIKKEVGSGYLQCNEDSKGPSSSKKWKSNDVFCEFVVDDAYRCMLRGVRSPTNDVMITSIHGSHQNVRDDDDVVKIWINEQEAKYIPEMSNAVEKFKHINDLRIWSCGLKYIERTKLAVFAKRLRVLDFFNNHIEEIPADAFDDLLQLQELKILNNRVKRLSENLFQNLRNLKWFFAEFNEIEELPSRLFDNTQIVVVSMKNNLLSRIHVDFRKLRDVNVIDFNQNKCINQCLGHYCNKLSVNEMQREIEEKCQ